MILQTVGNMIADMNLTDFDELNSMALNYLSLVLNDEIHDKEWGLVQDVVQHVPCLLLLDQQLFAFSIYFFCFETKSLPKTYIKILSILAVK